MLTGGCQCGAARHVVRAVPEAVHVCHCRECRRQSASAFGISVSVAKDACRLERSEVRTWSRRTDSGRTLDCRFCPVCGTRLWHEGAGRDVLSVKGGTLDDPVNLRGAIHIWASRTLNGVAIPAGAEQWPEEPA